MNQLYEKNKVVLYDLLGVPHATESNDKLSGNYKYPLTENQGAQNQKQTNTGVLAKL